MDLDAVIDKAREKGVIIELNADPAKLDLDWRWCRVARDRRKRSSQSPAPGDDGR